jgi:hypothetical protein
VKDHEEEWRKLCGQAAIEQDPEKLLQLTHRILELLEAKEKRLQGRDLNPMPRGNGVLQIAYDEMLLITRARLLKSRGYEVTSVLGNDDAKRALDKGRTYRLIIVGHASPRETRQAMIQWLKTTFPGTKVLALNPPHQTSLAEADYNVALNGPEEWLSIVASSAG